VISERLASGCDDLVKSILFIFGFVAGLALIVFGWWGFFTRSGQHAFPEMAGILPFYAFGLGLAFLFLISVVCLIYRRRRRRGNYPARK
jgi:hypothetical protein